MCLENVNMPGNMSRVIFSLLLCGTALQGLEALKVIHFPEAEAAVGQNVTLPCVLNDTVDTKISQVEWRKKPSTKLVVYHARNGAHYFSDGVVLRTEMGDGDNELKGSYLQLGDAQVNDSGTYVCELVTYPHGSVRRETRLNVKDAELTCDKDSPVAAYVGDNVTVHCEVQSLYPLARYEWSKNGTVVSEESLLEVGGMGASQAGVYTLTVSTGHNKTLQRSFNLMVLRPTESPHPEFTSQNTNHSSTGVYAPTTTTTTTTGPIEANSTVETGRNVSSSAPSGHAATENPHTTATESRSFTARPANQPTNHQGLETHQRSTERTGRVTDRRVPDDVHHHQHTASSSSSPPSPTTTTTTTTTRETETTDSPAGPTRTSADLPSSPRLTTVDQTVVAVVETSGSTSRYGWLALVVCLVIFVMLGVLYKRHIVQKRQDLPPPFKPPPPPVKYTSISPQQIPMSGSSSWEGQLEGTP